MTMTAQSRDVWVRAAKTFAQTLIPAVPVAYSALLAGHGPIVPAVESALFAASASAGSILWNGAGVIVGARRARQLDALAVSIAAAVAHARAAELAVAQMPAPATPPVTPVAPA